MFVNHPFDSQKIHLFLSMLTRTISLSYRVNTSIIYNMNSNERGIPVGEGEIRCKRMQAKHERIKHDAHKRTHFQPENHEHKRELQFFGLAKNVSMVCIRAMRSILFLRLCTDALSLSSHIKYNSICRFSVSSLALLKQITSTKFRALFEI